MSTLLPYRALILLLRIVVPRDKTNTDVGALDPWRIREEITKCHGALMRSRRSDKALSTLSRVKRGGFERETDFPCSVVLHFPGAPAQATQPSNCMICPQASQALQALGGAPRNHSAWSSSKHRRELGRLIDSHK